MEPLDTFGRGLGPPGFLAVGAAVGDGEELSVLERGDDEQVAGDDRRRDSRRDRHLPLHVFLGADFDGRRLIVRDPRPVRPAETGPRERLIGAQANRREQYHREKGDEILHEVLLPC